jgi:uncharacterized repeat protein (TIGR03803 family)
MTYFGGANNLGCIFSIDTNGSRYKDLLDFDVTNGATPTGDLTLLGNKLYGMTLNGDENLFSIDTNGTGYKALHGPGGALGSLVLASGKLYGMTYGGGGDSDGVVFSIDTNGSGYKQLLSFNGSNGASPKGSLILSSGTLYGMTETGGTVGYGIIFSIDTNGNAYKDLFDFNGTNGGYPSGSLTLLGNVLYGMAAEGGTYNDGVVFKIDTNSTASINEITLDNGAVNVYPNPSNGSFNIKLTNFSDQMVLKVYNVLGQNIYETKLNSSSTEINLQNQPDGVYFYRLLSENSVLIGDGKLIIQK